MVSLAQIAAEQDTWCQGSNRLSVLQVPENCFCSCIRTMDRRRLTTRGQGNGSESDQTHAGIDVRIAASRAGKQVNTQAAAVLATLAGLPHLHTLDLASSSSQYLPSFRDLERCKALQARCQRQLVPRCYGDVGRTGERSLAMRARLGWLALSSDA